MSALNVSDLTFSYPGRTAVLQGISLSIAPGERVGLIGPNGVGKTTFFHSVTGVLRPTDGKIELFGRPVVPGRFHPERVAYERKWRHDVECIASMSDEAKGLAKRLERVLADILETAKEHEQVPDVTTERGAPLFGLDEYREWIGELADGAISNVELT